VTAGQARETSSILADSSADTDLGPGGGHIVAEGTRAEVLACEGSPTGRALREPLGVVRPKRPMSDVWLDVSNESKRAAHLIALPR
jgi:excinuclease UvrABC ATPase subunit